MPSKETAGNGKINGLVFGIKSYSKAGLKKLILKAIKANESEEQTFGQWIGQKITVGLVESLSASTPEDILDIISSYDFFNELVCKKISEAVNKSLKKSGIKKTIKVNKIVYKKVGRNGLSVSLKFNKLDIDSLLESVLAAADKEACGTGLAVANAIQKSVPGDNKLVLVNSILGWLNDNSIINTVIGVLCEENKDFADIQKLLKLDVAEVSIE